ncbi:MAG TPA: riboflavin biosynthesis protein RibF [Candidatus Latescibacteria bacterium]|nr:riboflavin biosynthesis protein RibF [Candidatus Latescibacterota bacterium]
MQTITLKERLDLERPVLTVGTFDGVHLGHRGVLRKVQEEAASRKGTSVVVTFDPHPRKIIEPDPATGVLTSLPEKQWRIEAAEMEVLAVVPFTQELRNLTPEAFAERYLVEYLDVSAVVLGYDHGFGKGRSGDLEMMQLLGDRFGYEVYSVPPVLIEGEPISSTRIRGLLLEGNLEKAGRLLGGGYTVIGQVEKGDGRGTQIGFPTANVSVVESDKILPADGVYAAWVYTSEWHPGILNLGFKPTFNGKSRTLEVHILDYSADLYDHEITLELVHRIRGEQRFEGPEELISQIETDIESARKALSQIDVTLTRR